MIPKDVVILCGGLGKRLRSVSGQTPKVMMEIDRRPFLDVLIEHVKRQHIKRVILLTGYQAYTVEEYYRRNTFGLSIAFSREDEPLGTGGALRNARKLIGTDPFFLLNGDSFCPIDLADLLKFHRIHDAFGTLAVARVSESKDFGAINLDKNKRITAFMEKTRFKTSAHVNAGVYCLSREVFDDMPGIRTFSLEVDCFPRWLEHGMYGYTVKENFLDIGTPDRYRYARSFLKKK